MEVNEMIKPNIINGLDLRFSSFSGTYILEDRQIFIFFFINKIGKRFNHDKF